MGFLSNGITLHWKEAKKYGTTEYVKDHGVLQLIQIWNAKKDLKDDKGLWGDEVEFIIVEFDDDTKQVFLTTRGAEILHQLEEEEGKAQDLAAWRPEYGVFMIEAVPSKPYAEDFASLAQVEKNMKIRRDLISKKLGKTEHVFALTHFPLMGVDGFFHKRGEEADIKVNGPIAQSKFIPDQIINPHRRFATLTNNILTRRGRNVEINIPLFMDTNTKSPDYAALFPDLKEGETCPAKEGHVYADAMAFGMGQCCSQVTFQTKDFSDGLNVYDRLIPLGPIMLALTAGTPILRGHLVETDVRWHIIEASVDDRTDEEQGNKELKHDKFLIDKSRYSPVSCYISQSKGFKPEYNDTNFAYHPQYYQTLVNAGLPELVAKHYAHLFIRDPLVIYEDRIVLDDSTEVDHFENVQSSNWQSCRFKPPPLGGSSIGWRVEFRTMELMFTDFENAAVVNFVCLLVRMIQKGHLSNIYMPISQVAENMRRGQQRDAVHKQNFFFKHNPEDLSNETISEFTLNQILNGHDGFPGFVPLVREFVKQEKMDAETFQIVDKYLTLISKRADGSLMTNATWIRNFVAAHPAYKKDSIISQEIAYDLLKTVGRIETKDLKVPEMYGDLY